jgi:hypothetical protein
MNKRILIGIAIVIVLYFIINNTQLGEHFVLPFGLGSTNVLEDGIYVVTNKVGGLSERCLTVDNSAGFPHLLSFPDQMCGYKSREDLLSSGNSVWLVKCIDPKNNLYVVANGSTAFNKCLITGDGGRDKYPFLFSWNYTSNNLCGMAGGVDGILQSNGQAAWVINPVGKNMYTVANYSDPEFSTGGSSNVWSGSSPNAATSAPLSPSDINNSGQIAINNATTIPTPRCLAIIDGSNLTPERWINTENPSGYTISGQLSGTTSGGGLCGFNSYSNLINDSRAVWNFYKVGDI